MSGEASHKPASEASSDLRQLVEQALDYRGDVTLRLRDGQSIEGYVYDRRFDGAQPCMRLLPLDGGARRTVPLADVVGIEFTGRDMAAGKSWETWVKNYREKKARGEKADLHPESLD